MGLGFWGRRWIGIIMDSQRVELSGFCGTKEETESICAQYGISRDLAYTDYKEAIEKTDSQIAVNVLPGVLHFDADKLALEKGLHIITEKPLAMSMDEANALLKIKAANPRLKFMTCQNYRWRPHNQAIKNAIQTGLIGDIESLLVEFRKQEDLQGYRAGLEQPLLQDVSIHHFDLVRFFTGARFKSIYCHSYRPSWSLFNGRPNTDALIKMDNNIRVVYNGSWAARGKESSWDGNFTITGSKGCLTLDADNNVYFFKYEKDEAVVMEAGAEQGMLLTLPDMAVSKQTDDHLPTVSKRFGAGNHARGQRVQPHGLRRT